MTTLQTLKIKMTALRGSSKFTRQQVLHDHQKLFHMLRKPFNYLPRSSSEEQVSCFPFAKLVLGPVQAHLL